MRQRGEVVVAPRLQQRSTVPAALAKTCSSRSPQRWAQGKQTGERVWLPPEAERGWNEMHVKRRFVQKQRDLHREELRKTKAMANAGED